MAETRKSLTRTLYLNGALALAVLTVLVHLLLRWATTQSGAADAGYEVLVGTLVFLGVAGAGSFAFFRWVVARLIRPLDSALTSPRAIPAPKSAAAVGPAVSS